MEPAFDAASLISTWRFVALIETLQKMLHEERMLRRSSREAAESSPRSDDNKVFAKLSCPDQCAQSLFVACNDPHIDRRKVFEPRRRPFVPANAKQFHLKAQTGLRYLVQENRAALVASNRRCG